MQNQTISKLMKMKQAGEKIAMLTCYDACFAQLLSESGVDVILVGDTLGMVIAGFDSTVPVTMEQMVYHVETVARGNKAASFLIGDMPYMSYANSDEAVYNAARLMQAGAQMIKLEGGEWLLTTVKMLTERGIPVCCHLGLTPQSVHKIGGYRIQGRDQTQRQQIIDDALRLEAVGAQMLVLECVPHDLASEISQQLTIPVIGIGAGNGCDGQVLVLHDMLGLTAGKTFTFVKDFMQEQTSIKDAITAYVGAVKAVTFPTLEHSFS